MKKILLLFTKDSVSLKQANPDKLESLLNSQDPNSLKVYTSFYEDLLYDLQPGETSIFDTKNGSKLEDYDVVYFRRLGEKPDHAMACALYLESKGVTFMDTEIARPGSMSKLTQYMRFSLNDLPFPKTLLGPAAQVVGQVQGNDAWSFPVIAKAVSGTRGADNYLVKNETELSKYLETSQAELLVQEFIPNDGDYRVLIFGGAPQLMIKRIAPSDSHTNNTSQGGSAEQVPLAEINPAALKQCVDAVELLSRQIAGVDIVKAADTGKYYIFEVNRAPQIEDSSYEEKKAKLLVDYWANC